MINNRKVKNANQDLKIQDSGELRLSIDPHRIKKILIQLFICTEQEKRDE